MGQVLLPTRQCATCTASQKVQWGCDSDTPIPLVMDGVELRRCPLRPLLDDPQWFTRIFRAWRWYSRGFLPEGGTWLDQPAKLVGFLQIIDSAKADAEDEDRKREERKRSRNQSPKRTRTPQKAARKGRPLPTNMTGHHKPVGEPSGW